MGLKDFQTPWHRALAWGFSGGSNGTTVLSMASAFTFGSAGSSMGWRFNAMTTSNLTDFYFFLSAVNGTPGNLTCEVRNDTGALTPGSTILATQTITWDGTTLHWNHVSFGTPASLTQNTTYWVIIYNADPTPATNSFSGVIATGLVSPEGNASHTQTAMIRGLTTSNGWSTSTNQAGPSVGVMKFANGTIFGNPYNTNRANYTSNQLERGWKFSLPFDAALGIVIFGGVTGTNGIKIYPSTAAPGGTALFTQTFAANGNTGTMHLSSEFILVRNKTYRLVLTYSANSTGPQFAAITDYARFADVQAMAFGAGRVIDTIDNGAGGWTDGTTGTMPLITLIFNRILSGGNSFSV